MPPITRPPVPRAGDDEPTVMRLADKRLRGYLATLADRYPHALGALSSMAAQKGLPDVPAWPDWCWLPMGATHAAIIDSPAGPLDPRAADLSRVSALAAWRLTKGIYWVESELAGRHVARLWKAKGVPADPRLDAERFLTGMPQHCVYTVFPPADTPIQVSVAPPPLGVFIHLEHDTGSGRPELRLVVDTDGSWDGLLGIPVLLDRPTLMASTREGASGLLRALPGLRRGSDDDEEALTRFATTYPFQVWPAVQAVTDEQAVISGWARPGERPPPASLTLRHGTPRWEPAPKASWWRVGTDQPRAPLTAV